MMWTVARWAGFIVMGCSVLIVLTLLGGKWIPVGWQIAYTMPQPHSAEWVIHLADVDRGFDVALWPDVSFSNPPTLSPDRQRAVWTTTRGRLLMYNSQTDTLRDLGSGVSPVWSPDSRHMMYQSRGELFVLSIDENSASNQPAQISIDAGTSMFSAWSPDGRWIAFERRRRAETDYEVYIASSDGKVLRNISNHPTAFDHSPSWLPDSRHLVFISTREGRANVYLTSSDRTFTRRLTDNRANDGYPALSPDGRRLAYLSTRGGKRTLYVREMRDNLSAVGPLSTDMVEVRPRWSPDGSRLAVIARMTRTNYEIFVIDIDSGSQLRLTDSGGYSIFTQ